MDKENTNTIVNETLEKESVAALLECCETWYDISTVVERAQRTANRKYTCKLRKQLPQFYNADAATAHNTTTKRNVLQIEKTPAN